MELTGSGNGLAPGVQVREYHLQGMLGEGGFGIVYRAHDVGLDRTVAIKEYMPSALASRGASNRIQVSPHHKEAFDAGLRSFINEARLLAKFSHPALVHVYRFFEENGTAYMVMRYYEGQTFRAFLTEQHNVMDERWLTSMLNPILDGLEMLHAADCFHRDIAPDNVFLRTSGMPVLLDFGAARRIIGDMTQALTMVLKPGYAPIEQYADDGTMPQGAWTDVYQLGALLYRAITGKVPAASVGRMINDSIRMLTPTEYPGYSEQFLRGVHQALAVRPENRPQSIAEFKSLLGLASFTASELSGWFASDAMPLDMLERPQGTTPAGVHSPQPSMAMVDLDVSEATTVPLVDQRGHSSHSASNHSPVPVLASKAPVVDAAATGKALWQPPAGYGVSAQKPPPPPTATSHAPAVSWKLAAFITSAVVVLAGAWSLFGRKPSPERPVISAADKKGLEAIKTGPAQPGLNPPDAPIVQAKPVLSPAPPSVVPSVSEAVQPPTKAPVAVLPEPVPEKVAKPVPTPPAVPSPPAANSHATTSVNTSPPPPLIRPKPEVTKTEAPPVAVAESKPPAPVQTGTVALKVTPWGNVRVNRSPVGSSPPLTQLNLPEGQHQIEISNDSGSTVTKLVQVTKGEVVILSHKFE